eukprot:6676268-Lingulodinium_polyedra.AAC.1
MRDFGMQLEGAALGGGTLAVSSGGAYRSLSAGLEAAPKPPLSSLTGAAACHAGLPVLLPWLSAAAPPVLPVPRHAQGEPCVVLDAGLGGAAPSVLRCCCSGSGPLLLAPAPCDLRGGP